MTNQAFTVGGFSVSQVVDRLQDVNLSASDRATLIGSWILENAGRTPRVFNYATQFPAVEADCVPAFQQTFEHADWHNFIDVVAAEASGADDGFNGRFHRIQDDIASLGAELAKAFTCLAEMRKEVRGLLDELRTELNRINSDVFSLTNKSTGTTPGLPLGNRVTDVLDASSFKGVTKFLDKDVSVWQTDQGIILMPSIQQVQVGASNDPRVVRVGDLSRLLEEKQEAVFTTPQTKEALIEKFADTRSANGLTIHDLVAILPDDATTYENADALVDAVAEREAGAIRSDPVHVETLASSLSVTAASPGAGAVAAAPVTAFDVLPPAASAALITNDVGTIEKLSAVDSATLSQTLSDQGVRVTAGDVAAWKGSARLLSKLRVR